MSDLSYDFSDETTGLPPLEQFQPEHGMLVMRWAVGTEGIVEYAGETMPVKYLSVRGLVLDDDGLRYNQVHLAIPAHAAEALIEHLEEGWFDEVWRLADQDPDSPDTPNIPAE